MASLRVGRYETVRPIASGGMATVYLGRSRGAHGFERQVAIKAMHPHLADDPDFVAMFLDEARMASNIRHPNVVPTLDIAEEDGRIFLVMEYVEGLSVQALQRALRKKQRSLPASVALRIALDMLAGLHAAHELRMSDGTPMQLVHRDVSPQNVLVGADGVARIMDFGIARAETRITSTLGAQVKGKVPYMSPEQLEGKPVDRRSDVYAAGIVTWELLAGERLFRAENDGVLFNVVLRGAQQPPSQLNRDVPAPIDAICMRALSLSPDDRFPTAAAFAEALEDAVAASQLVNATPRVVAAFLQELSLTAPRGAEAPLSSSVTPSGPFGPSSLDPSSFSSASRSISGETQPTSGVDADSAVVPRNLARGARGSFLTALAAASAASLITGVAVWILARDQGAPLPPATGASSALSAATPTALETSPPKAPPSASTEAPAPSGAASAAHASPRPAEPPKLGRPKPPPTKGPAPDKRPPPKATSTPFRPEEP